MKNKRYRNKKLTQIPKEYRNLTIITGNPEVYDHELDEVLNRQIEERYNVGQIIYDRKTGSFYKELGKPIVIERSTNGEPLISAQFVE